MKYSIILTTLATANLALAYYPDDWQEALSHRDLDSMSTILLARGYKKSPQSSQPRQRGSPTAGQAQQKASQQSPQPPIKQLSLPSQKEELRAADQGMKLAPDVVDSIGSIHRAVSPDRRVSMDKKQQRRDLDSQEDIILLPRSSSARSSMRHASSSFRSYKPERPSTKMDPSGLAAAMNTRVSETKGKSERPSPKMDLSSLGAGMLSPGARLPAQTLLTHVSATQGKPERPPSKWDLSSLGAAMLSPGARLPAEALNNRIPAKQTKPEK